MDWKAVPSLAALRAFEAAARTGSIAEAAGALNVTHAAISQHVRALERGLGAALLVRGPRGVVPTPEGAALAGALAEGFGRIAAGVEALRAEIAGRPLTVAVTPTFAENWLMPRLGRFWAAHPGIEIALRASGALADLARGEADVAVRYGMGDWPGLEVEPLMPADFVVVAAPALARAAPDFCAATWFFQPYSDELRAWATGHGLVGPGTRMVMQDTNSLTLAAVLAGHGLSAQTRVNVDKHLASGALVELRAFAEPGRGYFLVTAPGPGAPGRDAFAGWLRAEAAA